MGSRGTRMMPKPDHVEGASLEEIAMLSMEFGQLLMECGASARIVEQISVAVARGLGAETVDLRIGYASLAITSVSAASGSRACARSALSG